MTSRPIGRDEELLEVDRFLGAAAQGAVALLLEGPAGIGKSTLWSATVEAAGRRGFQVLAARPTAAEATWAYQSLADLLEPVAATVLPRLPPVQRRALELALLRTADGSGSSTTSPGSGPVGATPAAEAADGGELNAQAIAVGAVSAIAVLAAERPILVAIDDVPWLDPASAEAIAFVVRRLARHRVGVLLAQRVETPGDAPLGIDTVLPTERRWIGPLALGAIHLLLSERLGLTLPRPTLAGLQAMANGNPFHALEIGRALGRLPNLPRPGDPLPIPESLRGLVEERLASVSAAARRVLLTAAAAGSPDVGRLAAALGSGGPALDETLAEAVDAGLLAIEAGTVRFSHPTIATAAYEAAAPAARRAAHAALAAVEPEAEARARHLALATVLPDAAVADALEAGARDARRRGAMGAAAELARLAVERTPPTETAARDRRELLVGSALVETADLPAARELLVDLAARMAPGRDRAEARMLLGTVAWYTATSREAVAATAAALEDAGDDRELIGRLHYRLAVFHDFDQSTAHAHGARAVDLLRGTDATITLAAALATQFACEVSLGHPPDLALLDEALAVEGDGTHVDQSTVPGIWYLAIDRPDLARERFQRMLEASRAAGEISGEADLLTRLAETELYADRWAEARRLADEATIVARQEGNPTAAPARRVVALIDAHAGRLDEAQAAGELGFSQAEEAGDPVIAGAYALVLVFVAVTRGDHAEAIRMSELGEARLRAGGRIQPLRLDSRHERVEALAAIGRLDEAEALLVEFAEGARILPRPWADAAIARGRASIAIGRGDHEAALEATAAATDERSAGWRAFDRARTLLVRGRALRQARSSKAASDVLDAALATFEELGAAPWAAHVRAELDRLGRRRPGTEDLTPTERRVAELAAGGLRNREVASTLGISPKTVEAHLARAYAKLGIRTRAELGRRMSGGGDGAG